MSLSPAALQDERARRRNPEAVLGALEAAAAEAGAIKKLIDLFGVGERGGARGYLKRSHRNHRSGHPPPESVGAG